MNTINSINFTIDQFEYAFAKHNNFCLLDWLIDMGHIPYSDYENWRNGEMRFLHDKILVTDDGLQQLTASIEKHAKALGLTEEIQDFYSWHQGETRQALQISQNPRIHDLLSKRWLRAQDLPQLDLFMDNTAVTVENAIYSALAARDFAQASIQLKQLTDLNNKHPKLGSFRDLILYCQHMETHSIVPVENLLGELQGLAQEVAPLAKEVLGGFARDFLAFPWRRIADSLIQHSQSSSWHYDQSIYEGRLHASYCLMQIPDWHSAYKVLGDSPMLFTSAPLLLNYALCSEQLQFDNAAKYAWIHLFERDTEFAENAIESKQSQTMWLLWQDFWEQFEEAETELFTAFVLAKYPGMLRYAENYPAFKRDATLAMQKTIEAKLQKQDDVSFRLQLKGIDTQLLQIYIAYFGNQQ